MVEALHALRFDECPASTQRLFDQWNSTVGFGRQRRFGLCSRFVLAILCSKRINSIHLTGTDSILDNMIKTERVDPDARTFIKHLFQLPKRHLHLMIQERNPFRTLLRKEYSRNENAEMNEFSVQSTMNSPQKVRVLVLSLF